jgi:TonB family protein
MVFRWFFGLPGAALATALLFIAMAYMVRQTAQPGTPTDAPPISIIAKLKPTPIKPNPPATKIETPDAVEIKFPEKSGRPDDRTIVIPPAGPTGATGPDIDVRRFKPTYKIAPQYPDACRARGAQGVVIVEFDVTPEGSVVNPRIIASPDSCFDRAVLRAALAWKYEPPLDATGRPSLRRGVQESVVFQLTEE